MTCWTSWQSERVLLVLDWHTLEKNISFAPLFMTAATGGMPQLIFDLEAKTGDHAVSGYLFQ